MRGPGLGRHGRCALQAPRLAQLPRLPDHAPVERARARLIAAGAGGHAPQEAKMLSLFFGYPWRHRQVEFNCLADAEHFRHGFNAFQRGSFVQRGFVALYLLFLEI